MDSTNQGIAAPGVNPAGTAAQQFAIKRLQQQQARQAQQRPGRVAPPQMAPRKVTG